MAEFIENSENNDGVVDMHIMECSDNEDNDDYVCKVPTQNSYNGEQSGRGTTWNQVRRSKRKKVSSSGSTDTVNKHSLKELSDDDRFMCLHDLLTKNSDILNVMRSEQTQYFKATEELQTSVVQLSERADRAERVASDQNEHLKLLTYRSIDLEARSRRNNIILYGISERCTSDTVLLVVSFLEDELEIDAGRMAIERAHRLGARITHNRRGDDPKRPIIVRFRDFMDTELIMRRAYKLKGSHFGIDRDYPKEIAIARKELYTSNEARDARQNRNKVQIVYPAKLIIDGQLKIDRFPEWQKYMAKDRMEGLQSNETSVRNMKVGANDQGRGQVSEKVVQSESDKGSSSGSDSESESVFSVSVTKADDEIADVMRDRHAHQTTRVKSSDQGTNKLPRRQSVRGRRQKHKISTRKTNNSGAKTLKNTETVQKSSNTDHINSVNTQPNIQVKAKNRTGVSPRVNRTTTNTVNTANVNSTRL